VDLVKGVPFLCKVLIKGQRPPLTINLKYLSFPKVKLKICGSFTKTHPNSLSCDNFKEGNPFKVEVKPKKGAKAFHKETDYYFMSFEVDAPCQFTILPKFASPFEDAEKNDLAR
jgi:hypothetical protein